MPGFNNIDDIRQVAWDQGYLWDIWFKEDLNGKRHKSKLKAPFDSWFPATTVNEERFSMQEHGIEIHQWGLIPFPNSAVQRGITIGFYDDVDNNLTQWITTWVKTDILNDGKYLTPLAQCTKELYINKLNHNREITYQYQYLVIPSGNLDFQGTEHADSTIHSVRFIIVGESSVSMNDF